jgi:hypothetical protein
VQETRDEMYRIVAIAHWMKETGNMLRGRGEMARRITEEEERTIEAAHPTSCPAPPTTARIGSFASLPPLSRLRETRKRGGLPAPNLCPQPTTRECGQPQTKCPSP